jgi:anti-sigma-K factor RskA
MTTADVHTLTGAYAADALDPDEREIFERHLRVCPSCAQELLELQETAARLGTAAAAPPPGHLRARVMAEVSRTRQLSPLVRGTDNRPAAGRGRGVPRWLVAAAASFAVVAAGLGVVTGQLYQQLQETRQVGAQVNAVLTAQDAQTATASSGAARGTVVVSRQRGQLVFLPAKLADVPQDRIYQLWLLGPGDPRPAGLLGPDDEPSRPVITRAVGDIDAVAVTVEPAGGSRQPTTPPVLVVRLPPAA